MKKLVMTVLCAGAFAVGTVVAGTCGGGGGECGDKGKDKGKDKTKESMITHVVTI